MNIYITYFVLIVSFNHCCGASNLIPTAIYSQSGVNAVYHDRRPIGAMSVGSSQYYPIYSMPFTGDVNEGELQYSASLPQYSYRVPQLVQQNQPQQHQQQYQTQQHQQQLQQHPQQQKQQHVSVTQNTKNLVNREITQKPRTIVPENQRLKRPKESQTLPAIRLIKNNNAINQSVSQRIAKQEFNPKPIIPMLLKSELMVSTVQPMLSNPQRIQSRPKIMVPTKLSREPKSESIEGDFVPRVHTISFNWPKKSSENQANNTQITKTTQSPVKVLNQSKPANREIQNNFQINSKPQIESTIQTQTQMVSQKRRYEENINNLKYESPQTVETAYQTPTPETELYRETTSPTTSLPLESHSTEEVKEEVNIPAKEEIYDSSDQSDRKEKLSSVDSEVSYQTQYFESKRPNNDNYEPNIQINDQMVSYETPFESSGAALPENEVIYANPEPESVPVSPPVSEEIDPYYLENAKDLSEDKNSPKLKVLLEQFIQQLDLLKFVAAKELQKTSGNDYSTKDEYSNNPSVKDGDVVQTSVIEPSVSKKGLTYDDYQNERSFEQNSNSESKPYKDTNDNKYYGRYDSDHYGSAHHSSPKSKPYGLPNQLNLKTADSIPNFRYKSLDSDEEIVSDVTLSFE